MLMPTRRSHGSTLLPLVLTAILAATALSAIAALAVPQQALGAATYSAKCEANLRTKPSNDVHARGRPGGWRPDVRSREGHRRKLARVLRRPHLLGQHLVRISNVAGKSALSRYGVTYVYAATALFVKSALTKRYAKCEQRIAADSTTHLGQKAWPASRRATRCCRRKGHSGS